MNQMTAFDNEYDLGYQDGELDFKEKVLKILNQAIQNADLSYESADTRFIDKINELD